MSGRADHSTGDRLPIPYALDELADDLTNHSGRRVVRAGLVPSNCPITAPNAEGPEFARYQSSAIGAGLVGVRPLRVAGRLSAGSSGRLRNDGPWTIVNVAPASRACTGARTKQPTVSVVISLIFWKQRAVSS